MNISHAYVQHRQMYVQHQHTLMIYNNFQNNFRDNACVCYKGQYFMQSKLVLVSGVSPHTSQSFEHEHDSLKKSFRARTSNTMVFLNTFFQNETRCHSDNKCDDST